MRVDEDKKLEQLRKRAYDSSVNDQKRVYKELQLQRQRAREEIAQIRSNRIAEYEKELERTRYDAFDRSRKTAEMSNYK